LKALPVLALSLALPSAVEKELKDSGVSFIINKPLRYSTLASVLLEAIGISPKAATKKPNKVSDNSKLLSGKRLLVVMFLTCKRIAYYALMKILYITWTR
jgi:histidine kinase 2/3/4 (cytokinin receptor)